MLRSGLLLILTALTVRAAAEVRRVSVFVGVDEGLAEDRILKYASRDAEGLADVFRRSRASDRDSVFLLSNPSLDQYRSLLKDIGARVRSLRGQGHQTQVLLYYSGHGGAEGLHVKGQTFPRRELNDWMDSLVSDMKILILDACESGDFLRRKGGRILEDREITRLDKVQSQGTIVLSSSSRGEAAQESEDYHGAVFSHHLENGLRGIADFNSDGMVSLLEAFEYARTATRSEEIQGMAGRQNPAFDFDVVGESDPVLVRVERRNSRLIFEDMPGVALEIFNAQTQNLERRVWLTGKSKSVFQLPSGKYLLRYPEKEGYRLGSIDLAWSPEAIIRPGDFHRKERSMLQRKGGTGFNLISSGLQLLTRYTHPMDKPVFGADYVMRSPFLKQTLGFGYGRVFVRGNTTGVDVSTQTYRCAYAALSPLFSSVNGQFLWGVEAAWERLGQELHDRRFQGATIMADGKTVPDRWEAGANVWSVGVPVEIEIFLPLRLWISASAHGNAYRYLDMPSGEYRVRYRLEPALALGHQF